MDIIVFDKFKSRLGEMGLSIDSVDEEDLIYIIQGDERLQISLDNVTKSYHQDGNFDHLDGLMNSIKSYFATPKIPSWEDCRSKIYLSLFPSDFDFTDYIHEAVTAQFDKVYVLYQDSEYTWINYPQLKLWEISEETFNAQVAVNMDTLLLLTAVETHQLESGETLGYFESPVEELKAALLFSPRLKEKVESIIGWPVYCVLPVRDFCYLFSSTDSEVLIGALEETVLKEYNESAYPVTTEIIRISDDGITAIGKYQN